ncbi:MAG: DUF87 domain-containing protein [Methylocystaceae bacterium]|nr:DUF87 domain-containing protein [Methylocystaceae bacterium]
MLVDYEDIAGQALGLPHSSDEELVAFSSVGTFRIIDHPATYDAVAIERLRNVSHVTNHPKYRSRISDEELAKIEYFASPETFSDFIKHVTIAPSLIKEYTRVKADNEAYEELLKTLESHIEADHPGILRKKGKKGDISYGLKMSKAAEAYERQTGVNFLKLKEKAGYGAAQLEERYDIGDIFFLRDFWIDGRFSGDVSGYLQHLRLNYPKFFKIMHMDVPMHVREEDRKRHTYIVGGTGSGKSELIKLLANNDIVRGGSSVVIIDPHGDLVEQIARLQHLQNEEHTKRVIYIDPFLHGDHMPVLNPLDCAGTTAQEREVIADQLVNAFEELLKGSSGNTLSLNMRALLKPCFLVLLDAGNADLMDLQDFLNDDYNAEWVELGKRSNRRTVSSFFDKEFHNSSFQTSKESLRNKLQSLFSSSAFCDLVNGKSTVDLKQAIDDRSIILFNLSKGRIGTDASEALGRFVIASLKGIAMRRANMPEEQRIPIHLYIDECQNYIGPSIQTIVAETRKYKLHLTLAQQIAGDGMGSDLKQVVFNNTQVNFAGRTKKDSNMPQILGVSIEDLQGLATGQFYCRIGSNPSIKMKAYSHLQDKQLYITDDDWRAFVAAQWCKCYRPIGRDVKTSLPSDMLATGANTKQPFEDHSVDLV